MFTKESGLQEAEPFGYTFLFDSRFSKSNLKYIRWIRYLQKIKNRDRNIVHNDKKEYYELLC